MNLQKHKRIFNLISPVYNRFYSYQCREYGELLNKHLPKLNLPSQGRILDLGCGTGALVKTFSSLGYEATGVDMSEKMLKYPQGRGLNCQNGNILEGLSFPEKSFDLVTSFFVAHGLDREKRLTLFKEAARLTRGPVLIHDYSEKRRWFINLVEYLEDGDYFNFIKTGLEEMRDVFSSVEIITIKETGNWYICRV